jgi:Electron transfer DM13
MKLKYLVILGTITLIFGCTGQAEVSPPPANNSTVNIASPTSNQTNTATKTIKLGTFIAGEHETTGEVKIFTENGKTYLELDKAFNTSTSGPSLYIVLHRSDDVLATTSPPAYPLKEGDYVTIAPLQKYSGSQRYPIPQNINLKNYQSAVIWCRPFNATFGTAKLRDL